MNETVKKSVGEIVAEDYRAAQIFENHKIDFCCNGDRNVQEVAEEKDLDLENLLDEISEAKTRVSGASQDFDSWPLDLLSDYIEKTHHRYSEKQIPVIKPYLEKIAQVHGDHHPELFEIKEIFNTISGEMAAHQKKEEIILFPFIKKLVEAEEEGKSPEAPMGKSVGDPVDMMTHEHDDQGDAFKKISELSDNYTTPSDGCNTYQVTLNLLKEFEADLHKHIHLENNILFPKAVQLEKQLSA